MNGKIRLRTLLNRAPAGGLQVSLTLRMSRKNDFQLIVGPSDEAGALSVSWQEIEEDCRATKSFFLIDYWDLRAGFTGEIEMWPLSLDEVNGALAAYQQFKEFTSYPPDYEAGLLRTRDILAAHDPRPDVTLELLEDSLALPHTISLKPSRDQS